MSRVVNSWWFNDIGIVKVHDDKINQDKFYIGRALGFDEQADIEYIKSFGTRFYPDLIK